MNSQEGLPGFGPFKGMCAGTIPDTGVPLSILIQIFPYFESHVFCPLQMETGTWLHSYLASSPTCALQTKTC